MSIDPQSLPDDENGQRLRRMLEAGEDLSQPRTLRFTHVLPDEDAAQAMADAARGLGYLVELRERSPEESGGSEDWELLCSIVTVPDHAEISSRELELAALARTQGGEEKGWAIGG